MNGRGLSKSSFVAFIHTKGIGFTDIVKADVCVSIGKPENKPSTRAILPVLIPAELS